MTQRVHVRGLARFAARIFFVWGAVMACKGLWDVFRGEPEANFYSPRPWEFITREHWLRYAVFEWVYGLACLAAGWAVRIISKRMPEWIERESPTEIL